MFHKKKTTASINKNKKKLIPSKSLLIIVEILKFSQNQQTNFIIYKILTHLDIKY